MELFHCQREPAAKPHGAQFALIDAVSNGVLTHLQEPRDLVFRPQRFASHAWLRISPRHHHDTRLPQIENHQGNGTARERLIKTGARLVRHGRYTIFQMAAAVLPKEVFAGILGLINTLRGPPVTAVSS